MGGDVEMTAELPAELPAETEFRLFRKPFTPLPDSHQTSHENAPAQMTAELFR